MPTLSLGMVLINPYKLPKATGESWFSVITNRYWDAKIFYYILKKTAMQLVQLSRDPPP